VWWLVSPQNPLKPVAGMAPFAARFEGAAKLAAANRGIVATALEGELGTRYSVDTVAALKRAFPRHSFVWLMGADNLAQLPLWKDWTRLFALVPIAVFDRAPYAFPALTGAAAARFARDRHPMRDARRLAAMRPPAWIFFRTPLHPASATALRQNRGGTTS
jgi:nicotinate-nucleotide adenylyltransferase